MRFCRAIDNNRSCPACLRVAMQQKHLKRISCARTNYLIGINVGCDCVTVRVRGGNEIERRLREGMVDSLSLCIAARAERKILRCIVSEVYGVLARCTGHAWVIRGSNYSAV